MNLILLRKILIDEIENDMIKSIGDVNNDLSVNQD